MSSADHSDRIRDLFDEVVGLGPEERAAYLTEACGDDEELRREVESLLEAADGRGSGLRRALEGLQPSGDAGQERSAPGEIPGVLQTALADRYRIEREIGRGGMATVYLADDLKHPRRVAIKVLNPDLSEALGAERFLQEIETASSLTHPHILPLYDSGEAEGLLYYVMPYVKGESLRDRLRREKELPVEDAVRFTREIADALSYAHEEGVIHRDVKPANILLEADHAVLADFGVAKAVADMDRTQLTQTGTSLGTPTYMSPEQASGEQALDGRSDQYALGCVLYEMLVGEPPFRGARAEAVVRQHLTVEPNPVTQARPSVPEGVAAALHRALAKNPADRFQTTNELRAALAEGLRAPGPPVRPPGRPVRKTALIGSIVLIALVGAWTTWSTFGSPEEGARPLVAVLPFENLSPDSAGSFFAGGVEVDLTTKLTRIPTIDVIDPSSVEQYGPPGSRPSNAQIARQLGVDYLIGAGARLWGDSVRITVQLMDDTGVQVWAGDFDAPYTPEGYVRAQSEIVQAVTFELRAVLSPDDREWLQEVPTHGLEAFEAYLRGNDAGPSGIWTGEWNNSPAIRWYEEAVELDPDFSLAMARLALLGWQTRFYTDGVPEKVMGLARRALAIEPELVEARLALFRALPEGEEKAAQLDTLQRIAPDHPSILGLVGQVQRGAGELETAIESWERVLHLDPRNRGAPVLLTTVHVFRHQYDEALQWLAQWRAVARDGDGAPNRIGTYIHLARGDTARARTAIARMLRETPHNFYNFNANQHLYLLPERLLGPEEREAAFRAYRSRPHPNELDTLTNVAIHETAMGHADAARAGWRALTTYLEGRESPRRREYLALAYMGLDDQDAALELARWWEEQMAVEDPEAAPRERRGRPYEGWDCRGYFNSLTLCPILANIYAQFGKHDRAIDLLEEMLPAPSWLTVHILEVDPIWDPLREHPRFKALLEEYADDVEH
jgi:serine/threonine-protein kinase